MFSRRLTCAVRAASRSTSAPLNPAGSLVIKRWQSQVDTNSGGNTLGKQEFRETPDPSWRSASNITSTFDGTVSVGEMTLVPGQKEPDTCVLINKGDPEYLDSQEGVLEDDGKSKRVTLPALWLRDNCQCSKCINPETQQRTFNTFHLESPRLVKAEWANNDCKKEGLWKSGSMPESYGLTNTKAQVMKAHWSDGHVGEYSKRWMRKLGGKPNVGPWGASLTWDAERFNKEAASWRENPITYEGFMQNKHDSGMSRLMENLNRWGVATIEGVPHESGEPTEKLLEMIGPIRNTHYGGFYDFTADLAKKDTAYTNQALAAHTDTTYFTEPAGLQAFHVLSHKDGKHSGPAEGGETILVDGMRAAVLLEKADPRAFKVLTETRIPWYANGNAEACITPDQRYPVIERHTESGLIKRIRWNNDDRGTVPVEDAVEWYDAARKFHALLSSPEMQIQMKLRPGTLLIFNNWRVLHGRTAFSGDRRVCGAYINRDDFQSRWRLAKATNDFYQPAVSFQNDL